MWVLSKAQTVTLPQGKNSVMGFGKYRPDPVTSSSTIIENGVRVPIGRAVERVNIRPTSLIYDEFIIYDVNQVLITHVVKVKFNDQ